LDARTGRTLWRRSFPGCVASSPAVARGVVYLGFMDPPPCTGTSPSFLVALDARRGQTLWRFRAGPIESSPLVAAGLVYFGSTNGPGYAFATRDGRPLWSRRTGSFVYAAAAIAGGTAFVGSYDHRLYALAATTGAVRWTYDAGAPISGAPTVLDGLVYFSTCGSCSKYESNPRARRTFALDTRTGRLVWRFPDGEYSPVIADRSRVYLTGYTTVYALAPAGTATR